MKLQKVIHYFRQQKTKIVFLNSLKKKNNKHRKKHFGKKRRILASILLVGKLLFGEVNFKESRNDSTRLTHEKVVIASVLDNSHNKMVLVEDQMDFTELRGGDLRDWGWLVYFASLIWLQKVESFQAPPGAIIPPHHEWVYGNQQPGNEFGYGKGTGPRSITVTQSAGSEKGNPSSGSYNYNDIMNDLNKQSSKRKFDIQVGAETYRINNPHRDDALILESVLGEKMYHSIRQSNTDVFDIASNLGFKVDNIKNVKDHVFYNEHKLDRYPGEIDHKRFDANLQQALAWKRLETGTHDQHDVTWLKHECAERRHELKYNSGYSEAHDRAQKLYDGSPWPIFKLNEEVK